MVFKNRGVFPFFKKHRGHLSLLVFSLAFGFFCSTIQKTSSTPIGPILNVKRGVVTLHVHSEAGFYPGQRLRLLKSRPGGRIHRNRNLNRYLVVGELEIVEISDGLIRMTVRSGKPVPGMFVGY